MPAPDVVKRDGRDARGAVGVNLGDSCSLLVGLGLVVERSRVEEAEERIVASLGAAHRADVSVEKRVVPARSRPYGADPGAYLGAKKRPFAGRFESRMRLFVSPSTAVLA